MKKNKKVALYDPYLDILGGGERYLLSIMRVFEERGFGIDIFWDQDLQKEIRKRFSISFKHVTFQKGFQTQNMWAKIRLLRQYDHVITVTDGSYFFSPVPMTIYCMVPDPTLYSMNVVNRIKTVRASFITHSRFTQKWLRRWGIDTKVLYTYIDKQFSTNEQDWQKKDNIILSVGRFFPHLHSKRHDVAIKLFKKMKQKMPNLDSYSLVIAGGLKDEDIPYFDSLQKSITSTDAITLLPNASFDQLISLYRSAKIYLHCAGYGIDDSKEPQSVEHFGITPLEAMAAGAIPVAFLGGGIRELIRDGQNGYTFETDEECVRKVALLAAQPDQAHKMRNEGAKTIAEQFSYAQFKTQVETVIMGR